MAVYAIEKMYTDYVIAIFGAFSYSALISPLSAL